MNGRAHGLPAFSSVLALPLLLLLLARPPGTWGTCRFPDFLQREPPWAASYAEGRLVVYVKGTYMSISQQVDHVDTKYSRKCERRGPDNKFLVMHQEAAYKEPQYLCMQFLQRSENIVQMKVSQFSPRQSLELCDERMMALDRWPIVQMSQTPEQKIPCPFMGGYNVHMYYPNDTAVCTESTLLMRIESECEQEEGIVFDFRMEECVPHSLPRTTKQQAYCIAHWTQGSQTFIILQHAQVHKQTWCLRISDTLSDIHSAHLMLDLVCDTGDVIRDTRNFFRLTLTRRVYASTCEDEVESDVCRELRHLCKTHFKRHCARTCGECRMESEMGDCTFQEKYRGLWVDSGKGQDKTLDVGPYSLDMQGLGRYVCLRLESKKHEEKRVLVRIDENGCYPRYACVEMDKVESSVLRFRMGDRHQWPLPQKSDQKDHVCSADNFLSKNEIESRFHVQRPPRLMSAALPQHRMTTLEYSCLAAFTFHNNTYAVVTKTSTYSAMGQYLCWVFTPDNHIKVAKAAETFLFEEEPVKQELLEAQFSILPDDSQGRCQNVIAVGTPPSNNKATPRFPPMPPEMPDPGVGVNTDN
nr:hypothetical protein BaRGS_002859 [Batillaria attramentaria]